MKKYYLYWQGPVDSGCETYYNLIDAIKGWWEFRRIAVCLTTRKVKTFEDD